MRHGNKFSCYPFLHQVEKTQQAVLWKSGRREERRQNTVFCAALLEKEGKKKPTFFAPLADLPFFKKRREIFDLRNFGTYPHFLELV